MVFCITWLSVISALYCFAGADKIVSTPCRVECLVGFRIKMIVLGSEHSIAITGE